MLKVRPILMGAYRAKSGFNRSKDLLIELKGDLIHGLYPVHLALQRKRRTIHKIFYNKWSSNAEKVALLAAKQNIPCQQLSRASLDSMTKQMSRYKQHHVHQGLAADVSKLFHIPIDYKVPQIPGFECDFERLSSNNLILFLYNIKDPMNLGALLRSAYFYGVTSIVVGGERTSLTPTVTKASSGAMELLDVYAVNDSVKFLARMSEQGWTLTALTLPSLFIQSTPLNQVRPAEKSILIVGSEGTGIPDDILRTAHRGVYLSPRNSTNIDPDGLIGGVDSLNVSVATGIALHHFTNSYMTDT